MRNAPQVQYPVGRSVWPQRLLWACCGCWAGVQGLWWAALGVWWPPGAWWVSTVAGVLLLLGERWRQRQAVVGTLSWVPAPDAPHAPGRWLWRSAAYRHGTELARLDCALDLQGLLLLRAHNAAGQVWWWWLERAHDPPQWPALRRALVAHREASARA